MIVIRDPKTFNFNFHWPKDVDENMKHEIEFIIKNNESLAENKIKNEIEQLLLKYKHGNNIHEHRKQQKFKQTCCSSKLIYLLHVEKYEKTV